MPRPHLRQHVNAVAASVLGAVRRVPWQLLRSRRHRVDRHRVSHWQVLTRRRRRHGLRELRRWLVRQRNRHGDLCGVSWRAVLQRRCQCDVPAVSAWIRVPCCVNVTDRVTVLLRSVQQRQCGGVYELSAGSVWRRDCPHDRVVQRAVCWGLRLSGGVDQRDANRWSVPGRTVQLAGCVGVYELLSGNVRQREWAVDSAVQWTL